MTGIRAVNNRYLEATTWCRKGSVCEVKINERLTLEESIYKMEHCVVIQSPNRFYQSLDL